MIAITFAFHELDFKIKSASLLIIFADIYYAESSRHHKTSCKRIISSRDMHIQSLMFSDHMIFLGFLLLHWPPTVSNKASLAAVSGEMSIYHSSTFLPLIPCRIEFQLHCRRFGNCICLVFSTCISGYYEVILSPKPAIFSVCVRVWGAV